MSTGRARTPLVDIGLGAGPAPNFECFTKYDAFCSHSFDYACFRRLSHIVIKIKHCIVGNVF